MKIGIITDCLKRKTLREAIEDAKALGVTGVQMYATEGELCPENLTADAISGIRAMLKDSGIEVSALCGDMGGFGFEIEADNPARIEKTKRIIDLCVAFGTSVVTTHIGVIPADKSDPCYGVMLRALTECGQYALSRGICLAIETGPESAAVLKRFLDDTKGGVGVNLDPANFIMVTGQDPVAAVELLSSYIVHTHAKDGRKLDPGLDPATVYHGFAVGGVAALNACKGFSELPIGEGDVDWDGYIAALKGIGYDGYLTIEREAGGQPLDDIAQAVSFLKKYTD